MDHTRNTKHKGASVLLRDDFDAGPTTLNEIESKLWIGNLTAATDLEALEKRHINHILTVDSCPLPKNITMLPGIKTKFVQATDNPREDLLSHLEDVVDFIKQGQENGGVLVHCYFGMSRSPTMVIAYLMKKYCLSYDEGFEIVKTHQNVAMPNQGFQLQLKLFHTMGWKIDKKNLQFRLYRLQVSAENVKKVKILPKSCADVIKPDPGLITVSPEPLVYCCRKCRRIVASASNLLPHIAKERPSWTDSKWSTASKLDVCTLTYFVEPLAWMKLITTSQQGKLCCPKCEAKLGSFSWTMGCQCPCGSKISPAFYFVPSKVEWSNIVQNVQVTV